MDTKRVKLKKKELTTEKWYLGKVINGEIKLVKKHGIKSHDLIYMESMYYEDNDEYIKDSEQIVGINFYNEFLEDDGS